MAGTRHLERFSDADLLKMLHLRDHGGLSASQIGAAMGVTKGRVSGALHRVDVDLADSERGSSVVRPENMDGSLPPRWWAAGLSKRWAA